MKKNLTVRYVCHQMTYWAAWAGIISFASTYLLGLGFPAAQVGVLLAAGNLLSCAIQPVLASLADRLGGNVLKWLTVILTCLCVCCFTLVGVIAAPGIPLGIVYLLGVFTYDAMMPLMNATNVFYTERSYRINYGLGRGLGSLAFSLAALVIGKVMAAWGNEWMIRISLALLLCNAVIALGYPSIGGAREKGKQTKTECCSIVQFFAKYRWYCVSLLGVMFLGMFLSMTENYLIEVVTPLGGDSGSVGIALFIATFSEAVVIMFFDKIRSRIPDNRLLKIAGLSFLAKALLFLVASDVSAIYWISLLQATSYTFLSPTQMYYANAKVSACDMVKGQAFITASYTLGCAAGNFAGGQLLQFFDVTAMLVAGVIMALAGTLVLFLTVDKKDI